MAAIELTSSKADLGKLQSQKKDEEDVLDQTQDRTINVAEITEEYLENVIQNNKESEFWVGWLFVYSLYVGILALGNIASFVLNYESKGHLYIIIISALFGLLFCIIGMFVCIYKSPKFTLVFMFLGFVEAVIAIFDSNYNNSELADLSNYQLTAYSVEIAFTHLVGITIAYRMYLSLKEYANQ